MSSSFAVCLEKVVRLNLLDQAELVDLGEMRYKHKNIVFDNKYHDPEIYIYETENLETIKDNLVYYKTKVPILHVFGSYDASEKFAEAPDFRTKWHIHGKWVEYIENYFNKLRAMISEVENQAQLQKEKEEKLRKEKEKLELEEKIKRFEKLF